MSKRSKKPKKPKVAPQPSYPSYPSGTKICAGCGTIVKPGEDHDCKEIRKRMARGVSADVERIQQRNVDGLKKLGCKGDIVPDPRAAGMPGQSFIE